MLTGLQLPFQFDPHALRADLALVGSDEWAPHYNERDYGGTWRGAALRSPTGAASDLRAVAPEYRDTPLLDRCPTLRAVLGRFACPVKAARLLALAPGSFIREHSDHALDYEDGEARIHVPVQTSPGVEFYVDGERLLMEEGRTYYVNVNRPHRVNNRGTSERVHLVIDVAVNDWVRAVFARSEPIPRGAPRSGGVEEFRDAALGDRELREGLRGIADTREFELAAVRLGRERGFDFHEGDVNALLNGVAMQGKEGGLVCAIESREGEPFCTWTDPGPLLEPFYYETVQSALRTPWGRFSRRVSRLGQARRAPKGLIFHLSRCGSTLVTQMLKAAGYSVVSEAAAVDTALRSDPEWLPRLVAAMGAEFVKFDAWHIHEIEAIRAVFPDTPWIFMHRDAVEVASSHRRIPGLQALPGAIDPALLRMTMAEMTGLRQEAWTEQVIAKMRKSAERHRDDPRGLFVDYRELPDAAWGRIARHFGLELTAEQVGGMREAARFDAKSPGTVWQAANAGTNAGIAS